MTVLKDESVELVVTSPPYPMIEMWDEDFAAMNPAVGDALKKGNGQDSFELMHRELDTVWAECHRLLRPGAFLCVNIGDATRKLQDNFRLYSNHSRIISFCESIGFQSLPVVLWRKQTNAPNKFMGSGMLPSGAYVTLEHEYILVLRKGGKRDFTTAAEKKRRRESAFFWEERNAWFSDIWDFKGSKQKLARNDARERSAAFPLELAHRLVNMYSLQGDLVLDPFLGTGTTMAACILNGRSCAGFEVQTSFSPIVRESIRYIASSANGLNSDRLRSHLSFVEEQESRRGKPLGHVNEPYGFRVMTRQETDLRFQSVERVHSQDESKFVVEHTIAPLDVGSVVASLDEDLVVDPSKQRSLSFDI